MRLLLLAVAAAVLFPVAARAQTPPDVPPAPAVEPAPEPPAPTPEPPSPEPAPRSGRLVGRVFERGGPSPIADATITAASGESTSTDGAGAFSLDLPPGESEIVISGPGFQPLVVRERIAEDEQLSVDYRLLPVANRKNRYRTVVRGEARHEGERVTLRDEELHQAPGSLGDPFRVVGSLPGVIAPLPLLPAFVVRGASPGMNGFFLDGMRVPQLFHFMFFGGVVHPRLVDRLDFYPGAYDASFGRYAGGIIDSATRAARTDAPFHGELELRAYDVSTLLEAHLPGGVDVIAGGRYGYPGPIIHLAEPRVDFTFADYQLRIDWRGLTLQALGSYDALTLDATRLIPNPNANVPERATNALVFHRVQLRYRGRAGRFEHESALVGGYDHLVFFGGQGVVKMSLSARLMGRAAWKRLRLQSGIDAELSRFNTENFSTEDSRAAPDALGELGGNRVGIVGSAYVVGTLLFDDLIRRPLSLTASVRADVYSTGKAGAFGVDPRLQLRYEPINGLEFNAGFGLYQQPPAFPLALPGIDTFALQLGLQRAWQGAVGIKARLPEGMSLSLTGWYARFFDINDVVTDLTAYACTQPPVESLSGVAAAITRQLDGQSFGMELLLRREAKRITGWIAYTLSRSERQYTCGLRPSDFDQTHVLNVVVQVRLPWRLMAGVRLYYSTGRPYTHLSLDDIFSRTPPPRNNDRMPGYLQIDARIDREWVFQRWALTLFVEVLNATYSRSLFGVRYPQMDGITRYDQPYFDGFNWILPSIGARGRF